MKLALAAAAALLAVSACAAAPLPPPAQAAGTVTGTVVVSPCHPGPDRVGDPPCPPRPGLKVHFDQASVTQAAAVTDATGTYVASLDPGDYEVWAEGGMGRGKTVPVRVLSRQTVTLNLTVDSGMR